MTASQNYSKICTFQKMTCTLHPTAHAQGQGCLHGWKVESSSHGVARTQHRGVGHAGGGGAGVAGGRGSFATPTISSSLSTCPHSHTQASFTVLRHSTQYLPLPTTSNTSTCTTCTCTGVGVAVRPAGGSSVTSTLARRRAHPPGRGKLPGESAPTQRNAQPLSCSIFF